jgi:plasmid stabilization system protein ParE
MPGKGHLREDLGEDLRAWVVYSYLIIYRPAKKPLQVVRVVSGYRDVPRLFE